MEKKTGKTTKKNDKSNKFESDGEEYIFLYETVFASEYSELITKEEKPPTVEFLKEIYKDILKIETDLLKNEALDKKYEGSKRYWYKEQEDAVVDYIKSADPIYKSQIFSQHLYKPLNKLIENIIFTFKLFRSDVEVKDLQADCMSFLITKIEKFDPDKQAQAFSYLGTIAKHYLMGDKRQAYKLTKSNTDIDECIEEASSKPENIYEIDAEDSININGSVFEEVIKKLNEDIKKPKMPANDRKVGEAIVYIFQHHDILGAYNKNRLYQLIKERTGLLTKDITNSLGRFKKEYEVFKKAFLKLKDENNLS